MDINKRFQKIINELYSGNKRAFSKAIGIAPTVVENIVGKRQGSPSFDVTNKLLNAIANINSEWLITGKGNMLKPGYAEIENSTNNISEAQALYISQSKTNTDNLTIPLYNLEATSSLAKLLNKPNKKYKIADLNIPNAPKCDGAIYLRGDSMYPILNSGDIICYKKVSDFNHLFWGEMYLLEISIDNEQHITTKYIQKSEISDKHILLVSENPNHQPMDILKTDIKACAIVKISIRYNSMH